MTLMLLTLCSSTLKPSLEFSSSRLDVRQLRKTNTKCQTVSFSWPPALKILILAASGLPGKGLFSNFVKILAQCLNFLGICLLSGLKIGIFPD